MLEAIKANEDPAEEVVKGFQLMLVLTGKAPMGAITSALQSAIAGERQAGYLDLVDPALLERAANQHGLTLAEIEKVQDVEEA